MPRFTVYLEERTLHKVTEIDTDTEEEAIDEAYALYDQTTEVNYEVTWTQVVTETDEVSHVHDTSP